jgi:hypothetical protein
MIFMYRTLATNCARIYNLSLALRSLVSRFGMGLSPWPFLMTVSSAQRSWRFPTLGHKGTISPMPCVPGSFSFVSMANLNYTTFVKSVYESTKMVKKSGLWSLMVSQLDVHAAQFIIARFLFKITEIASVLTMSPRTQSVQSSAVTLP